MRHSSRRAAPRSAAAWRAPSWRITAVGAEIAGRLAVLFEAARDFGASALYFLVAAQHAVGLFGFREALSLAERGSRRCTACRTGRSEFSRSSGCR